MALIVPTLKPRLQVVESGRGHDQERSGAGGDDGVHSLPISRAMRARSRNSYRFGRSPRRGRDARSEWLTFRCCARAAAAVPKSTSCSVIRTSVDVASTEGAAERGLAVGSSWASAALAGADSE